MLAAKKQIPLAFACLALVAISAPAESKGLMSEKAATTKAVDILLGPPYGETREVVVSRIKSAALVKDGQTVCSGNRAPVWQFHVVVQEQSGTEPGQDGYLVLDAATGEHVCHNLGLLD
jgi:hypothetical protein